MLDPFSRRAGGSRPSPTRWRGCRDGALRIRVVHGHDEGPDYEASTIREMRRGRADLAFAASRAWDEFGVDSLRALHAPLLIDSYELQERVLESELVDPMLEELQPLGLVGIGILPGPIRRPLGAAHRLAAPRDFRGLTIGTQQSRVADADRCARSARARARLPAAVPEPGRARRRRAPSRRDRLRPPRCRGLAPDDQRQPLAAAPGRVRQWAVVWRAHRDQRRILRTAAANVVPTKVADERNFEAETTGNICRKGRATFDSATSSELACAAPRG